MNRSFVPERRQTRPYTDGELLQGFDCWWDENHDSKYMRLFDPYDLCVGWMAARGLPAKNIVRLCDLWHEGKWKL